MTSQTAGLLGETKKPRWEKWQSRFRIIHDALKVEYGVPRLGNYRDPIKEIIYIVLSAKTTESLYQKANKSLWSRFDSVSDLAHGRTDSISKCIEDAGLGKKRAIQIKGIAKKLIKDFQNPKSELKKMDAERAYDYLTSLPGVGPKSALCVMMYSLDFDVFPVDVNVHRIAVRLGALRPNLKHYEAQKRLPGLIPSDTAKELHIGMVVHGRKICVPQMPRCSECCIIEQCQFGKKKTRASK